MAEEKEEEGKKRNEQPIIIKKIKKGGGHGAHGAWKVAYADFVTAMMAFFIVMWILGQSEDVQKAVADYFQNPSDYDMFTGKKVISVLDDGGPPREGGGESSGESGLEFSFKGFESAFKSEKQPEIATEEEIKKGIEDPEFYKKLIEKKGQEAKKKIEERKNAINDSVASAKMVEKKGEELKKFVEELSKNASPQMKKMLSSIEIEITKDGLKIELMETFDDNFFDVGSANLKPDAISILKLLAQQIGKLGNSVEVEGHTDSRAYSSSSGFSNWELSSLRANSARKVLETSGLWNGQVVTVSGFADRKLRLPNNPFDYSNRRITIVVKNLSVEDFLNSSPEPEE